MSKILTTLSLLLFISVGVFAQSQRFVIIEHFTNASCGPCASLNPALENLLNNNLDKATSIKYHTSWPGKDPMYDHNKVESSSRVSYYSVTGVPYAVMDGNVFKGSPAGINQTLINNQYNVPSPFELTINQRLNASQDSIFVTMIGKATQDVSGNLVAQCAIIEKMIEFTTPPGYNGEKKFPNVMKKMLPDANGTKLPASMKAGDYFIIDYAWKLANVYKIDQLDVIGFVQDNSDKNIKQGARTVNTPIVPLFQNDIELSQLTGVEDNYCYPEITPAFVVRNNGSNDVNSIEFKYQINDEAAKSYTYNGNLKFLETANISFPITDFTVLPTNTLKIYGVAINGNADQYNKNDTLTATFVKSQEAGLSIKIAIKTDEKPEETTWKLEDFDGNVILSGGPYANPGETHTYTQALDKGKCYKFTMYDAGNNGLCCENGTGFCSIRNENGKVLYGITTFESEITKFINASEIVSNKELDNIGISFYPNPVNTSATMVLTTEMNSDMNWQIIDIQGRVISSSNNLKCNSGTNNYNIDCANLSEGIYILKVNIDGKIKHQKFTVKR